MTTKTKVKKTNAASKWAAKQVAAMKAPTVADARKKHDFSDPRFPAGNRIIREYKGKSWTIEALVAGYEMWAGDNASSAKAFPSLTAAAKFLRGTNGAVSGAFFFGLWKPKGEAKAVVKAKPAPKAAATPKKRRAKAVAAAPVAPVAPAETQEPIDPEPAPDHDTPLGEDLDRGNDEAQPEEE